MHELAIADSVVRIACAHAAGRKVAKVELKVGYLRQVVPSALEFSFALVAEGTELEGAELSMEVVPAGGRCLACGSLAAMTSPVSRSATSHVSAEMSPGTGGVPEAVMMPQPDSASPPSGLVGTGSGAGGSPASGTSEESTAGGVDARYGQAAASGAAFGSAVAMGMPMSAGAASIASAATRETARVENIREVAIVSAD